MKVLVLGAGAYGLALATILSDKNDIIVYSVIKEEIDSLKATYKNEKLFSNIELPKTIKFVSDIDYIDSDIDLVVVAIPTNYIDETLNLFRDKFDSNVRICIASKGINNNTNMFAYDIVKKIMNTDNISIISGPGFAIDTIKKETIMLTLASNDFNFIKPIFPNYVKVEVSDDFIGVQLCGTLKNVFAISCGILEGMKCSESTKSALLTKIINEVNHLIFAFGGKEDTIFKACGIGDIILTCSSKKSRNFSFGKLIGNGANSEEIKNYIDTTTVEGLDALISIKTILDNMKINNELINLIYNIIFNKTDVSELLSYILI